MREEDNEILLSSDDEDYDPTITVAPPRPRTMVPIISVGAKVPPSRPAGHIPTQPRRAIPLPPQKEQFKSLKSSNNGRGNSSDHHEGRNSRERNGNGVDRVGNGSNHNNGYTSNDFKKENQRFAPPQRPSSSYRDDGDSRIVSNVAVKEETKFTDELKIVKSETTVETTVIENTEEIAMEVKEELKEKVEETVDEEKPEEESDYDIGELSDVDEDGYEDPEFTESEKRESKVKLEKQNEIKNKIPTGIKLFLDLEDKTDEALATFTNMDKCTYANKSLGDSKQGEPFSCECVEEYEDGINSACIDDDCINKGTKIECVNGFSSCGDDCANQRFQKRQYANIAVIQTELKGYGVRAEEDLEPDTFVYEYIGEVIDEKTFKKRMIEYDELNFKHFYFMMLQKGEFVDATRKGSLGRFCNHSCNPNCYVEKWVVNDKLRMGIFTKRKIMRGEELTFNYNVDRYGADAQKCYCGEANCIGFIGGKTQTESASLLPQVISEALGSSVEDEQEFIKMKQQANEDIVKNDNNVNTEFIRSLVMKPIDIHEVLGLMGVLLQSDDALISEKLIERIELSSSAVKAKIRLCHGYASFGRLIKSFYEVNEDKETNSDNGSKRTDTPEVPSLKIDEPLVLRVLKIMKDWPKVSKSYINRFEIIPVVTELIKHAKDEEVIRLSKELLEIWDKYEDTVKINRRTSSYSGQVNVFDERRRQRLSPPDNASPARSLSSQSGVLPPPNSFPPPSNSGQLNKYNSSSAGRSNVGGNYDSVNKDDQLEREKYRMQKEKEEREHARRELEREQERKRAKTDHALSKIIEEARKLEEAKRAEEEEKKRKEEEKRKKKEEYRRKAAARKRKLEEADASGSTSSHSKTHHKPEFEVLWKTHFAKYIPNMLKKYQDEFESEQRKKFVRDIILILIEKERKKGEDRRPPSEFSHDKKKKLKEFVDHYMNKLVEKHRAKKRRVEEK